MKGITEVHESALKLLVPHSVEETYATVVNEAMKLVGAKHGSIFVPEDGKLKRVHTSTKELYMIVPKENGLIYKAFRDHRSYLRSGEDLADQFRLFKKLKVGTNMLVPLTYAHITIGTLSVLSAPNTIWTDDDLAILGTFGPIATLAIRSAHLKRELTNALEMRDLFISMAAHELKTPITSIHLHAKVIEKSIKKNQTPKKDSINSLVEETDRLTRLINELMDVAYIQQGKLRYNMKKCGLIEIIKDAIKDYREKYPKYKFIFRNYTGEKDVIIKCDGDKIRQAVSNLLHNAVKFSEKGSRISVSMLGRDDKLVIKVKDQGSGIAENEMPHIFERYYRGDSKSSSRRGIGLGLALVKSIIDEHKGEIDVRSKVGEGTTFVIKLPKYK